MIGLSLTIGHNDYHPGFARVLGHGVVIPSVDPPSSVLGGEAFLSRIYNAYRGLQSPTGPNVWDTTLLIGWDEPGGTYDHVAPGPVPPPDPAAPAGPRVCRGPRGAGKGPVHDRQGLPGLAPGYAEQNNLKIGGLPDDPNAGIPPGEVVTVLRGAAATFFPLLVPTSAK